MMQAALQWLEEVVLDETGAILDERDAAYGVVRSDEAKAAGREAARMSMRTKWLAKLEHSPESERQAAELKAMGETAIRQAVRKMYQEGLS